MGLKRRDRFLMFVALVSFLGFWAYYDANCHCYGDRKECEAQWGWWCELIGSPAVAIAVVGTVVAAIGIRYIARQVRQGEENLAATRRAAEREVSMERGRVRVKQITISEEGVIDFEFVNIGRTPLVIRLFGAAWRVLDNRPPQDPSRLPRIRVPFVRSDLVLMDGVAVDSGPGLGLPGFTRSLPPIEMAAVNSGRAVLFVQFRVRYDDVFGVVREVKAAGLYYPDQRAFSNVDVPAYNTEKAVVTKDGRSIVPML